MSWLVAIIGAAVLAFAWAGPLPGHVAHSFTAHMTLHMMVVGIGAPLLAIGLAPFAVARGWLRSQLVLPIIVSAIDLIVVWFWHAPGPHHASRSSQGMLAVEQASFAMAAFLVWIVAFGAPSEHRQASALSGAMALFFTSMHMTLLGALLALAPRPLYGHGDTLADQQFGGAIMLSIGAVIYLGGALTLIVRVLHQGDVR